MVGNVIVGQSGGPTAVINSSLAGVFKTAKDRGARRFMVCVMASKVFLIVSMLIYLKKSD